MKWSDTIWRRLSLLIQDSSLQVALAETPANWLYDNFTELVLLLPGDNTMALEPVPLAWQHSHLAPYVFHRLRAYHRLHDECQRREPCLQHTQSYILRLVYDAHLPMLLHLRNLVAMGSVWDELKAVQLAGCLPEAQLAHVPCQENLRKLDVDIVYMFNEVAPCFANEPFLDLVFRSMPKIFKNSRCLWRVVQQRLATAASDTTPYVSDLSAVIKTALLGNYPHAMTRINYEHRMAVLTSHNRLLANYVAQERSSVIIDAVFHEYIAAQLACNPQWWPTLEPYIHVRRFQMRACMAGDLVIRRRLLDSTYSLTSLDLVKLNTKECRLRLWGEQPLYLGFKLFCEKMEMYNAELVVFDIPAALLGHYCFTPAILRFLRIDLTAFMASEPPLHVFGKSGRREIHQWVERVVQEQTPLLIRDMILLYGYARRWIRTMEFKLVPFYRAAKPRLVFVCLNCAMLKQRAAGSLVPPQESPLLYNPETRALLCNVCYQGLSKIDVAGHVLYSRVPGGTTEMVTPCNQCEQMHVYNAAHDLPLCPVCEQQEPMRSCFVPRCNPRRQDRRTLYSFVYKTTAGGLAETSVCAHHNQEWLYHLPPQRLLTLYQSEEQAKTHNERYTMVQATPTAYQQQMIRKQARDIVRKR